MGRLARPPSAKNDLLCSAALPHLLWQPSPAPPSPTAVVPAPWTQQTNSTSCFPTGLAGRVLAGTMTHPRLQTEFYELSTKQAKRGVGGGGDTLGKVLPGVRQVLLPD